MTRDEVLNRVTGLIREILDDETVVLNETTSAPDVPGWDSFNNINLMIAVAKAFAVSFRAHEIEALRNVGELLDMIERKLPNA